MIKISDIEYFSNDGTIRFLNMDCNEFMKGLKEKEFDLNLSDPPYGIGMSGGNVGYKGFNNFDRKEWDNGIPDSGVFDLIFKTSCNQIIWGGNYFGLPATRCYLVWDKGEGFYNRTYAECELAWTSFDKNTCKMKHDPLANGDYKGKIHPTQKPIDLYRWILQNYTKPTDTILDCFGGSMSNAIACHMERRKLTIIELDVDYFNSALKRFDFYERQLTLF